MLVWPAWLLGHLHKSWQPLPFSLPSLSLCKLSPCSVTLKTRHPGSRSSYHLTGLSHPWSMNSPASLQHLGDWAGSFYLCFSGGDTEGQGIEDLVSDLEAGLVHVGFILTHSIRLLGKQNIPDREKLISLRLPWPWAASSEPMFLKIYGKKMEEKANKHWYRYWYCNTHRLNHSYFCSHRQTEAAVLRSHWAAFD